jgi:hypothetical protein
MPYRAAARWTRCVADATVTATAFLRDLCARAGDTAAYAGGTTERTTVLADKG